MSMDLPAAPKSHGKVIPKLYPEDKILEEAERLINAIKQPERWTLEHCKTIAAYTLEINELKKQKEAEQDAAKKKRDERDFVPLPKLFKELGTFIKFFGLDTRLRPLTLSRVDVLTATIYYTIK